MSLGKHSHRRGGGLMAEQVAIGFLDDVVNVAHDDPAEHIRELRLS
jgi:hypothetical protein